MKKILLSLMTVFSIVTINAQALLNELYTDPNVNGGHSEFFELYNIAPLGTGSQNLDCYTLVTYYEEGNGGNVKKGFYVLDFPNLNVAARSWFVGAAAYPFNTQNPLFQNVTPDFSWNSPAFRDGSTGGSLTKWELNSDGLGYTQKLTPADSVNNFLTQGQGSSGAIYAVMLFRAGIPENFFFGGMTSGTLPAQISSLPNLYVDMNPLACSDFTINFASLGLSAEFKGSTPGTDNGYARTSDGKCGAWEKTASGVNHTPGASNGSATGLTGSLDVAVTVDCGQAFGDPYPRASFNVTGFSGSVTFAEDFPIQVTMYYDNNHNGILDAGDTPHNPSPVLVTDTAVATVDTFHLKTDLPNQVPPNWDLLFAFRTKRGCFDRISFISLGCSPLPVKLMSFTANRNRSNVSLNWVTSIEENSKGFEIQRRIGYGNWEAIGFVDSKAFNGNSSTPLSYDFLDVNATKGITQYRLKEVDIDGKLSYSLIRSVRGEGQKGKTIIYPNPSSDGKVSIIFDDVKGIRDVAVSDMSGRTVKQMRGVTNNNIVIDHLGTGMYTVRILNTETGEQVVEKFVVNKR